MRSPFALPGFALLLCACLSLPVRAQPGSDLYVAGQRQPVRFAILPAYQEFEVEGQMLRQVSAPVVLQIPFGRYAGLGLRTAGAYSTVDGLDDLYGLTDVQANLSGFIPAGRASVLLNLGVNAPSGTQQITLGEFQTLLAVSQSPYDFQTPVLGTGLGIAPGVTVAVPLTEGVVVGFGGAYQIRGSFEPIEDLADPYEPGNELLLTAGLDAGVAPGLTVSADVTATFYGADVIAGQEVFESGAKTVLTGRMRYTPGFHTLWLEARYRSRSKNEVLAAGLLAGNVVEQQPGQVEAFTGARLRAAPRFYVSLLGEARRFEESTILPNLRTIYGGGMGLDVPLGPQASLPIRALFFGGDMTGFEVVAGLSMGF